jgi:ATP-independent RNA helicase DbpA
MARDPEVHVHRIGRTGRAGSKGLACTLFPFSLLENPAYKPPMATLQIDGGRKQKVRPGDLLGALTGDNGIAGKQVGKIDIFDQCAYVAVNRDAARHALRKLRDGKIKGRSFRARRIS